MLSNENAALRQQGGQGNEGKSVLSIASHAPSWQADRFGDILQQFEVRLQEAGLVLHSGIQADGQLHRCGTADKPRGKDGAYCIHLDAPASAWWQNWRTGESGTWTAKADKDLTDAERQALRQRIEEDKAARQAEQERVHAEAASKAQAIYSAAADCSAHAYLTAKGVKPVSGLRISTNPKYDSLIVPVRNEQGKLVGLQFIGPDGSKKFLTGTCKKGAFFSIGGKDAEKPLLIAEGYATAASLHECLDLPVLVAFDAGNIPPVAEMARRLYPNRKLVICADHDAPSKEYPTPGGIGLAKAHAAALAVNGLLAVPTGKDGGKIDWNDLHQAQGRDEVWRQFCAADSPEADTFDSTACAAEFEQESRILPAPPPVPLEAFPAPVAAMLEEASDAFTVPLQIPATCLLGVLSCLVGGTRMISLRPSWKEPGNIWIATVAASGIGKTPCAAAFFAPVKRLEYEAFRQWQDEYATYENEVELVRKERAKAKRGDPMPGKPIQPQRRQAYIDDATVEALGEVLSENPRGIMWRKDELAGLIADLDKYSSGNSGGGTRSRLLSSYDGQEWKTSRTSNPTRNLYIPHAYVGIFGGIQPAMLPKVFEAGSAGVDEASGFLQRFMLIRAERERPGYWTEHYLSRNSKDLLTAIATALWSWDIEYDAEGREVEKIVSVSSKAKAAFVEWFNGIAQEEFLSQNAALLSKLKGQAQRLCLLLHCLDAALAGNDGMGIVTEDCMCRALLLADWVKAHQEQCWRFFSPEKGGKQADPIERAIMQVVVEEADRIEKDGWRISNADLCALVERKLNMPGLSSVKIGKAASGLGLLTVKIGEQRLRGRLVTRELINTLKSTASTVSPVPHHCGSRVNWQTATVSQPSHICLAPPPAPEGETDVRQYRDSSETVRKPHESLVQQQVETDETGETAHSENSFSLDFNDPNFPDEVRI